jgi:hypothetical protein
MIQVFQLNVETHPGSANVHDSLGEGYLPAGNRPLAIEPGIVAAFAASGDVRMIVRAGASGAQRLPRHRWRMSAALFVAAGSFFLGQPQFFPPAVRSSGLRAVPTLLVLAALGSG